MQDNRCVASAMNRRYLNHYHRKKKVSEIDSFLSRGFDCERLLSRDHLPKMFGLLLVRFACGPVFQVLYVKYVACLCFLRLRFL